MDYIQVELLRQTQAFAALLGMENETEGPHRRGENRAPDSLAAGTGEAAALAGQLRFRSKNNVQTEAAALGLLPDETAIQETEPAKFTAVQRNGSDGKKAAETPLSDAQTDAMRIPMMLVRDGALDARELSRVFERDTRRYNGAYPLY